MSQYTPLYKIGQNKNQNRPMETTKVIGDFKNGAKKTLQKYVLKKLKNLRHSPVPLFTGESLSSIQVLYFLLHAAYFCFTWMTSCVHLKK